MSPTKKDALFPAKNNPSKSLAVSPSRTPSKTKKRQVKTSVKKNTRPKAKGFLNHRIKTYF